jgi:thiosulfate/3-mercaptopyruvate sulfurtransferase
MPRDPFVDHTHLPILGAVRYLDVRDSAAFEAGHAPGAVRVPLERWDAAIKSPEIGFDNAAWWSETLAELGLGDDHIGVAYDAGGMTNAARVWFILQYFGLNCALLNGGWPALAAAPAVPAAAPPAAGGFTADPGAGLVGVVDRHTLKQQLDGTARVFDSRTRAEYTGEDTRNRARAGHLPGALHLSHAELVDDGRVHDPDRLRAMLEAAGFADSDRIVTHCEGGGRAALAAAAALRAGYEDVRVYYLSFGDWVRDETCPVVRD